MARVAFDREERSIENCTAECVVDDVEACAAGVLGD